MSFLNVNSSKGQVKIQQMAFVLVAIMIFFAIVALFYLSIRLSLLKGDVSSLREEEIKEAVRKIASTAEFSWTAESCSACLDADKALVLAEREAYEDFWDISFLQIERVYPEAAGECTRANYPDCKTITLVDEGNYVAYSAFVALCRYQDSEKRCEIGKVNMGFRQ